MADNRSTQSASVRRYRAPNLLVKVTQRHIDTALPQDSEHCMIADAIRDAFGGAKNISVDTATIRFTDPKKGLRYIYFTPAIAQSAVIGWDHGELPAPFEFYTGRAAQILSMRKGGRGEKSVRVHKDMPASGGNGARSRVQLDTSGRHVPVLIGGSPLPLEREPGGVPTFDPGLKGKEGVRSRKRKMRRFGIRGYDDRTNPMMRHVTP